MTTATILADACAVPQRIYLLFPAGLRLTLYSQQVRALMLVEALRSEPWMKSVNSLAVVGGGAAGLTAAAAVTLAGLRSDLKVTLFKSCDTLMPLQSGSSDKLLAPHLIDWPSASAGASRADLPVLGWTTDVAGQVATRMKSQFDRFEVEALTNRAVKRIEVVNNGVDVTVEHKGTTSKSGFDMVIVAVGVGLETKPPGIGSDTPSYWRVHPQQPPPLIPTAARSILISGLGDGGLIDFVMFACPGLGHRELCDRIRTSADAATLMPAIEDLEAQMWADPPLVIDIADAYRGLGLDPLARQLIVPNLRGQTAFSLLTQKPHLFHRGTAPINRLAAAPVLRAIELEDVGTTVRPLLNAQHLADEGAMTVYSIAGVKTLEKFDTVVVRHGDASTTAWDFGNTAIATIVAKHRAGRQAIIERPTTPSIPPDAETRVSVAAFGAIPTRLRLVRTGDEVVWQGDIPVEDVRRLWRAPSAPLSLEVAFPPSPDASLLDMALCRLIGHAQPAARLHSPFYAEWIDRFGQIRARAGDGMTVPVLHPGWVTPDLNRTEVLSDIVSDMLDAAMDFGVLDLLGDRFAAIEIGSLACPVDMEPALLAATLARWPAWRDAMLAMTSDERRWTLRMFGGLLDQFGEPDVWKGTRVGPKCIDAELLPAVLHHLVMQDLISDFGPPTKGRTGNVQRVPAATLSAAHVSGSRWATGPGGRAIEIDDWQPEWPGRQWEPSCLVLPNRRIGFLPETSFTQRGEPLGLVDNPYPHIPKIYNSNAFRAALRKGRSEALDEMKKAITSAMPRL